MFVKQENEGMMGRKSKALFICSFMFTGIWMMDSTATAGEKEDFYTLDYRYQPPREIWQTSICLVDDPQKTLVLGSGQMLYDLRGCMAYGGRTTISADVAGGTEWIGQSLHSPRVPLLRTIKKHGEVQVIEEAFAAAPEGTIVAPLLVERIGLKTGNANWANPSVPCDGGFRNIALAEHDQVVYRFRVSDTTHYQVVFGLCEGYWDLPGQRPLDLKIEGRIRQQVDMIAEYGRNIPAIFSFEAYDENGDGWITLTSVCSEGAPDDNAILNCLWIFPIDNVPASNDILTGAANSQALIYLDCLTEVPSVHSTRNDILSVRLRNTGTAEQTVRPQIVLQSEYGIAVDSNRAVIGGKTEIRCTVPFTPETISGGVILKLDPVTLPAHSEHFYAVDITTGEPRQPVIHSLDDVMHERKKAIAYWETVDLPYDRMVVPDKDVQGLLDACIRNIYQAREIKNGLPAFQVGPSVYRGMWVVDGAFLTESVSLLGRLEEARYGIQYLLSFQNPDGSFLIIPEHWKETGIMIWILYHHARLSGDKAWLNEVWPKLEMCVSFLKHMRYDMCSDPAKPNYHLIPNGISDGGLAGSYAEYTNIYWNLIGLKAAVDAARWLDKTSQTQEWQAEYDDFYQTFQTAADRDRKPDPHGNICLPIRMADNENKPVQKAQWAFLHAIYPGMLFQKNNPIVTGNMAMLKTVELEGIILNTGWVENGLWGYFGSFYAHAWLWLGDGEKAARTLYAFGNHATPTLLWREEHMPHGAGDAHCGDMPHNWASAELIRLVRHSLVLERGSEMHLFEAVPKTWIYPGARITLTDMVTEFGPMSLDFRVAADGRSADLNFQPSFRENPTRCILHLDTWAGKKGCMELSPIGKQITIKLN